MESVCNLSSFFEDSDTSTEVDFQKSLSSSSNSTSSDMTFVSAESSLDLDEMEDDGRNDEIYSLMIEGDGKKMKSSRFDEQILMSNLAALMTKCASLEEDNMLLKSELEYQAKFTVSKIEDEMLQEKIKGLQEAVENFNKSRGLSGVPAVERIVPLGPEDEEKLLQDTVKELQEAVENYNKIRGLSGVPVMTERRAVSQPAVHNGCVIVDAAARREVETLQEKVASLEEELNEEKLKSQKLSERILNQEMYMEVQEALVTKIQNAFRTFAESITKSSKEMDQLVKDIDNMHAKENDSEDKELLTKITLGLLGGRKEGALVKMDSDRYGATPYAEKDLQPPSAIAVEAIKLMSAEELEELRVLEKEFLAPVA